MTKRNKTIGRIFVELGRITEEDVERALAYQSEHGGYFGEALVALGMVSRAEVEWSLANQFDIPFVRLHPDEIDHGVAREVTADWARDNLILPILRSGRRVTAVISDPAGSNRAADLREWTGAHEVDFALCPSESIATLIDAVFGEARTDVGSWLDGVVESGALELGLSVRRGTVRGWSSLAAAPPSVLTPDWEGTLSRRVRPWPELADSRLHRWEGVMRAAGRDVPVVCRRVGAGASLEWAAHLEEGDGDREITASAGLVSRIADLIRERGSVVVRVRGEEGDVRPHLPAAPATILGSECRSFHLTDRQDDAGDAAVTVRTEGSVLEAARAVSSFRPDAITLDVDAVEPEALAAARQAARLVMVHAGSGEADPPGVDVEVKLGKEEGRRVWIGAEA